MCDFGYYNLKIQIVYYWKNKNLIFTGPSGEPWLVVEFMCFGDLAEILRTNSGVLSLQRSDSPVLEMVVLSFYGSWLLVT